jgi:aryl-alcohol dehydrogenase-like predicted oxidoreductase
MEIINQLVTFSGVQTSRVGLGCMGMSEFYGTYDEATSLYALHEGFRLGYRHFDTADMYGNGHNERLLGKFLRELGNNSNNVLVATKVGLRRLPGIVPTIEIDSSPEHIRAACEKSLERLGVEQIGLLYLHRKSPHIAIEDTVGAMMDLVQEGKVGHIGLSEVSKDTLERACKVAPIAALQSEYSLWSRDVEGEISDICKQYNVPLVAYSPLGRGFLTGEWKAATTSPNDDLRTHLPRFQAGNVEANLSLLDALKLLASELGCLPAQVALAWVLSGGDNIHVIPGSTSAKNLASNMDSLKVQLTQEQRDWLSLNFRPDAIRGERYPAAVMRMVNV